MQIAQQKQDPSFQISRSAISNIENDDAVPNLQKAYALARVYGCDLSEIASFYGVSDPLERALNSQGARLTAPALSPKGFQSFLQSGFSTETILLRNQSGSREPSSLARLFDSALPFGYIGTNDRMMYPILPPGSLVQIDESNTAIVEGGWTNEYERPIFFIETRERFFCCWCELNRGLLVLLPHPLSGERSRTYGYPNEAEIIGQVASVVIRVQTFTARELRRNPLRRTEN